MGQKEANKRYYDKRIKPFRKNKGAAKQLKMRCFMCGHWLDYKKYIEKQPSIRIDIKSWTFGGRASIIVSRYADLDAGSREYIRKTLISKLKTMLRALNEPYTPLERVFELIRSPISRESYTVPAEQKSYTPKEYISVESESIPTKETTEVKTW